MKATEPAISYGALRLLDLCLHLVHLSIIFFFLFGWLFHTLHIPHFILAVSILFSWAGLGMFFGFGYCVVTDIQWKIKRRLNREPPTEYYVKYMIDKATGLDTNPGVINGMVTGLYFGILALSTTFILVN